MKSYRYTKKDEPRCAICNARIKYLQWAKSTEAEKVTHIHCRVKRTKKDHYDGNGKALTKRTRRFIRRAVVGRPCFCGVEDRDENQA